MITDKQLKEIMPYSTGANRAKFLPWFNELMPKYFINSAERVAMFMAQVGHESGQLRYVRELASGKAYDTGKLAANLGNTPEEDGDGERYKGRGLIQITGTTNYKAVSKALGIDFFANPEMLEEPRHAVESAMWFWYSKNLNHFADKRDVKGATRRINGGYNGLKDREEMYERALKTLDV